MFNEKEVKEVIEASENLHKYIMQISDLLTANPILKEIIPPAFGAIKDINTLYYFAKQVEYKYTE